MLDPMQAIFNSAEAAQDALYSQEGCEFALRQVLDQMGLRDAHVEHMVLGLIDAMEHFRASACAEVKRMQAVSMGKDVQ
jgi:hypothetical protein